MPEQLGRRLVEEHHAAAVDVLDEQGGGHAVQDGVEQGPRAHLLGHVARNRQDADDRVAALLQHRRDGGVDPAGLLALALQAAAKADGLAATGRVQGLDHPETILFPRPKVRPVAADRVTAHGNERLDGRRIDELDPSVEVEDPHEVRAGQDHALEIVGVLFEPFRHGIHPLLLRKPSELAIIAPGSLSNGLPWKNGDHACCRARDLALADHAARAAAGLWPRANSI